MSMRYNEGFLDFISIKQSTTINDTRARATKKYFSRSIGNGFSPQDPSYVSLSLAPYFNAPYRRYKLNRDAIANPVAAARRRFARHCFRALLSRFS